MRSAGRWRHTSPTAWASRSWWRIDRAGSVIGTAAGAKSTPDGYTLVMAERGSLAISARCSRNCPRSGQRSSRSGSVPRIPFMLVVNPSLP